MPKLRTVYRCTECGGSSPKWLGRCPACEAWGTLVEEVDEERTTALSVAPASKPQLMADVDLGDWARQSTGIGELDRVLGGGLVPGSVTLVGGEPGIGKSTLLLQLLSGVARAGARCLLVTAEESMHQVRLRADRLNAVAPELYVVAETSLAHVIAHVDELEPAILVVDSVQTVFDPDLGSAPGSVAQVRECAARLVREAKERNMTTLLVGHVTKDGSIAGPRVLEHVVDTVLSFEGERHHALRMLRAVKHRFGSTSELGLFEMTESGLAGVPDPSGLFLGDRQHGAAGSIVLPAMEGHRPLLVEVQALVTPTPIPQPRRSAQGLDSGRLSLVIAVLSQRAGIGLGAFDVHASAVGGVRILEPASDLALSLALASAFFDKPIGDGVVACGEVGLAGELRQVSHTARRLAEAARLGFTTAVVPVSAPEPPPGIDVVRCATVRDAVRHLRLA